MLRRQRNHNTDQTSPEQRLHEIDVDITQGDGDLIFLVEPASK